MAAMVQAGIVLRDYEKKPALRQQPHKLSLAAAATAPATAPTDPEPHGHPAPRSSLTANLHRTNPKHTPHPDPPSSSKPHLAAPAPSSSSRPALRPRTSAAAPSSPPTASTSSPAPAPRQHKSRRPRPAPRPAAIPRVDSLPFAMDEEDPSAAYPPPTYDPPLTPDDLHAIDAIRRAAQPTSASEHRLAIAVADAYLQDPPAPPAGMLHTIACHLDLHGYTVHIKTGLGGGVGRQCFQHQPHTFIQCGMLRPADASSHHYYSSPSGPATSAPSSLATPAPAPSDWTLVDHPHALPLPDPHSPLPTGGRLVVDPQLREQFAIASRTKRYSAVLAAVPAVFVGTEERLTELVRLLCAEVALSFKAAGLHMPPWREAQNIISKWMPARFTYTPMSPTGGPSPCGVPTFLPDGSLGHSSMSTATTRGGMPTAAAAAEAEQEELPASGWAPSPPQQGRLPVPHGGAASLRAAAQQPAVSIRYFKLPGGASC